ncbi:MAG: Nif3-like dinuclear metal center hexameric protein [Ruminococcus sp.]|nr:Nif3-like dinuclear metal center hexameric protein [Ruminococcus sp.]
MLDKRLQKCADLVSGEGIVCDVGTDHALLAAELINSGKCSKVIASDVKEGPLLAAAKTVKKYGISNKVQLILSDGLKDVPLKGVSDVVIAGMGGETIAEIIRCADRREHTNIRWILQPMTKPEVLRKCIYDMKLCITEEYVVLEDKKMYVVMCAEHNPDCRRLSEFDAIYGFFDNDDTLAENYRNRLANRYDNVALTLSDAGYREEGIHNNAIAYKLRNGSQPVEISKIYSYLDSICPFSTQEKWDNSGWLVESATREAETVILSLDITNAAVNEAASKLSNLIISHHPVIFDPIKRVSAGDPVHKLVYNNISAICMHTNLDIAPGGTNGVILRKFLHSYRIEGEPEHFEELGGDLNLGWIVNLTDEVDIRDFAREMKKIFGCPLVRFTSGIRRKLRRIAFCSGSGGSMLSLAMQKGCDALVTGDVKHDVWISAQNTGFALFDCGHFHTENPVLIELRRALEEKFPQLDVEIAESSTDPCDYV